jgi:hypothetical protein
MWRLLTATGLAVVLAILALDAVTPAVAQNWVMPDRGFRVDWESAVTKRGTALRGYVYNDHPYGVTQVRLLIDTLDASGQVAATKVGYLAGEAPAFNRLYFEVPVTGPASSYRVRVASWEAMGRGGP